MLKFEDYILDNIHGYIALTKPEKEIEKLPVFQRLRRIKQLGFANWIFPGAEHTRYSHSLGVMHIADQMAIKLGFNDKERQLIRLAGMLHDIGHYPLSHSGESAYKKYYKQEAVSMDNSISLDVFNKETFERISKMKSSDEEDINYITHTLMRSSENKFHHEVIGTSVIRSSSQIRKIIEEQEIDIEDICDIITGDVKNLELIKFVQLLHSELDADRIDYLLRDASSSGTSYGTFEINTLIKNFTLKKHLKYDVDIVGVNIKGTATADQFLLNRYFSYSQVVFNKNVSILNFMIENIIYWMLNSNFVNFPNGDCLNRWIEMHERDDSYFRFTDEYLIQKIQENAMNPPGDCPEIIAKMMRFISKYNIPLVSEPKYDNNIILSANENIDIFRKLNERVNSSHITDTSIWKLDEVWLTNHVSEDRYISVYESKKEIFNPDVELDTYLMHRLVNGVAIIEDDLRKDPYLITDSASSTVKELARHRMILLRQFDIN